ncbi:Mediator of RNA polymerase II transcription subunit 6 [Orchesella cincta]|uniref:Mediator of RNA polymerase II transcription subunit 6 n=1 Tax=Orchesella cincta TaxID=48709 RepID=A0A1D2NKE9_ORCCI|nr:Mediator of RNA polymerase II transcription subunit 6 [Orchesella cincta]
MKSNMTGMEYILLHVQEPILYVIRKQHRFSTSQVTPIADYYIIAGVVYQAPDLGSVVNSRLLNSVNHLQSAFDECLSYTRYHPSKGYSWEFKDKDLDEKGQKDKKPDVPSSLFQRQRVDMLLVELSKKFPPRLLQIDSGPSPSQKSQNTAPTTNSNSSSSNGSTTNATGEVQIKQEPNTGPASESGGGKSTSGPGSNEPPVIIKQEKIEPSMVPCTNSTGTGVPSINATSGQQQGPNMKPPPEKRPRL